MSEVTASNTETAAERKVQKLALPGQTPEGEHIFGVLVKRTYDIVTGKRCVRARVDRKLFPGPIFFDDPLNSTVKVETDFLPFKVATDVVLNGSAHAPEGKPVRTLDVSLMVAGTRKDIRVFGDRVCRHREGLDPVFTDPEPFTSMEVRYERAYGGVDIYSSPKLPCAYPRNPLGCGFIVGKTRRAVDKQPLPNLEDPKNLLTPARLSIGETLPWKDQPMPQSFGWLPMNWQPRAALAGVMPADRPLREEMAKALREAVPPEQREDYDKTQLQDMDFRFFNGASPGMVFPFLTGDEPLRMVNLAPEGDISCQLPGERPRIAVDIGMGMQEPPVVLHTVMIHMDERQIDLVWRAAVPYPGPDWLPNLRKLEVQVQ